jgi:hypothetical protein
MTDMLVSLEISLKDESSSHGISSELGDIDRSLDGSSELKLIGLNRDNLDKRNLSYKLFRILVIKAIVFKVPSGTFQIDTVNVSSLIKSLGHLLWIKDLCNSGVHHRFIKSPSFGSASGLNESSQICFRNMESC